MEVNISEDTFLDLKVEVVRNAKPSYMYYVIKMQSCVICIKK